MSLFSFFRDWRQHGAYRKLPMDQRRIVFYAEDGGSWPHYEAMIRELTEVHGHDIAYLTSAADDPVLRSDNPRIRAFNIGEGGVRTMGFIGLEADVMVMTMPDIETYFIKRSKSHPVHYAYVFHSIVSTHMCYRPGALDHFDTVLCVGPHHVEEIRATEKLLDLKPKELVEHGYNRLETILGERGEEPPAGPPYRVLVAPSWGPTGVLETCGAKLVEPLLAAGLHVTVRPHPMTKRQEPKLIDDLSQRFSSNPNFELDLNISGSESLHRSHIMISDWSGAALEYAFGLERPVLFIDVPRKVNNPEYEKLPMEPIEVWIREKVGKVVSPDNLDEAPDAIEALCQDPARFREEVRKIREETIFNPGTSGKAAADRIELILKNASTSKTNPANTKTANAKTGGAKA